MSRLVRDATEGPLCPNGLGDPVHEAHRLRVRALDAFYEAVEKNEDLEMPEPAERAYEAANSALTDRMDLFQHSSHFTSGNRSFIVEAYWYRCRVCGLVLPATSAEMR